MREALAALRERLVEIGEPPPRPAAPDDLGRLRSSFPGSGTERLCAWLAVCDGAELDDSFLLPLVSRRGRAGHSLLGIRESVPLAEGWLPIGGDRCGNWYCAPCDAGSFGGRAPVVFIDALSPEAVAHVVASDLAVFVVQLVREDGGEGR